MATYLLISQQIRHHEALNTHTLINMTLAHYVYKKLKDPYKEIRLLTITSKNAPDIAKGELLECSLTPYSIMIEDGTRASRVLRYMRRP